MISCIHKHLEHPLTKEHINWDFGIKSSFKQKALNLRNQNSIELYGKVSLTIFLTNAEVCQ